MSVLFFTFADYISFRLFAVSYSCKDQFLKNRVNILPGMFVSIVPILKRAFKKLDNFSVITTNCDNYSFHVPHLD
ncbi:hypothetical protein HOLleu_19698 [Holothuria leucospilota]|uniref:Uncharacterized protein n=1 Tax=Holothuria leucospilota TaxID=206669 RepID=A0A9Q1C0B6_HOLLE|nr:hypothetical protein HOLleu_19698 [Holothuria leucospilota]